MSMFGKFREVASLELIGWQPRLYLADALARLLPAIVGNQAYALILRTIGFHVGAGTIIRQRPYIYGNGNLRAQLTIGRDCVINRGCTFDLCERVSIGDRVTIGHEAMIMTSSHELGPKECRAGALVSAPVTIEGGAWIGSRSIILPGVTIGAGAVVSEMALVNKDVPPHTRVAGSPARVVEKF